MNDNNLSKETAEAPPAMPMQQPAAAALHKAYRRIASPLHTILILAILVASATRGMVRAEQMRATVEPDRVSLYLSSMLIQWTVFAIMLAGVRMNGSPLHSVLGERWRSFRQFLLDVTVAAVFWFTSTTVLSVIASLVASKVPPTRSVLFLLPHNGLETCLWIAVSITAGICEEAIFRGYLQRQFTAMTKSLPIGILLSAIAFGAAHFYQGPTGALRIGLLALLLGSLAAWRKSVRPGMISHMWGDLFAGVFARLLNIRVG